MLNIGGVPGLAMAIEKFQIINGKCVAPSRVVPQ
jgi:hypothetical protein